MVIVFPFLGAGFANISPTFFITWEVQTRYLKILKYSEQYIRDHLSGTQVRTWIRSEYDAVFNFSRIVSSNLAKHSLSLASNFYQENQTLNYSNSQFVLFILLKYCSLQFS